MVRVATFPFSSKSDNSDDGRKRKQETKSMLDAMGGDDNLQ